MTQPLTLANIETLTKGGASGQVAVGGYTVLFHAQHGAVAVIAPPESQPTPRLRSLPILQRPRTVRGFLGRQDDVAAALTSIATALPVGVHGPPGIGKSTLLRHLANSAEAAAALPDGVVHLSARQEPAEDLLQSLFEVFYDCDVPCKPTPSQVRRFLLERKALVLLDDAELERDAAENLLDSAPECVFVLATRERCLWSECRAIGLGGLPQEDARSLFERELGRSLSAEEDAAFESLYDRLEGHPLRLMQTAVQVRDGRPLEEASPIDQSTDRRALAALPEEEKRLLSALAAVGGGPVGTSHLTTLADVADPLPVLDTLLDQKLVEANSPRYSLTGALPDLLAQSWDLSPWRQRALVHFVSWAEARRDEPAALLEEVGPLRHLLDWAATAGRHAEALRLGRALDASLAVAGRWRAWERVLQRVRAAAEALQDRATEGWALHQQGTRLLCLDEKPAARQLLGRALAIRESLHDRDGAAVTRHNLELMGPLPRAGSRPALSPLLAWIALAVLVLMVVGIRLWSSRSASTDIVGATESVVPISGETPPAASRKPARVRLDETTEVTTDTTTDPAEPPPPITTDQDHPEARADEPPVEIPAEKIAIPIIDLQGWCCAGGKVGRSTEAQCTSRQGGFFQRERSAAAACLMAGCCVDGAFKLGQTQEQCEEAEGTYMSALEVPDRCKQTQAGWCCLPGGALVQVSREDCLRGEGTFLQSKAEAQRKCGSSP